MIPGGNAGEMKNGELWSFYALSIYKEFAALPQVKELNELSDESTAALSTINTLLSALNTKVRFSSFPLLNKLSFWNDEETK